jgi:hypothetical protein
LASTPQLAAPTVRNVQIPAELAGLLRAHLETFGTEDVGGVFRNDAAGRSTRPAPDEPGQSTTSGRKGRSMTGSPPLSRFTTTMRYCLRRRPWTLRPSQTPGPEPAR